MLNSKVALATVGALIAALSGQGAPTGRDALSGQGVSSPSLAAAPLAPSTTATPTTAAAAAPAAATTNTPLSATTPATTNTPAMVAAATTPACSAPSDQAVRDGEPIRVVVAPAPAFVVGHMDALFEQPPVTEPSWRMWFYAFSWTRPLVRRAVDDKQVQAQDALIGQVLDFYRVHPDRGLSVLGWDEGTSLRRLQTLNCLYRLTHDTRLPGAMAHEANVLFGPRYYGPPRTPVHNHGLMANLALVDAGRLVGRLDWAARASGRLRSEAGAAFTPAGLTYEQSSQYHLVNTALWQNAAMTLAMTDALDPTVAVIGAAVARAQNAGRWLTEPDGRIVQFGDAERVAGPSPARRAVAGVFRDDAAGLVVGRSGWTATSNMYTLRYGPRTWAHGHPDKSTVTWTARGLRVLLGSGYIGNEPSDPLVQWQRTPQATNAAIPTGRALVADARGTVRLSSARGAARTWALSDAAFGLTHSRSVTIDDAATTFTVADAFARSRSADQVWHLDPAWTLVSARPGSSVMTFRHPSGRVLRITTTGRLASAVRGSRRPVAGWTMPAWGQAVPAWELRVHWGAGTVRTVFRVS